MAEVDSLESLLVKIFKVVDEIGVKKFLAQMNKMNISNFSSYEDGLKSCIIAQTCLEYKVKIQSLKDPYVSGDEKLARTTCFILLKHHLNLTHVQVAMIFGRNDHSIVSEAMKKHLKLNNQVKSDREFSERYSVINQRIESNKDTLIVNTP